MPDRRSSAAHGSDCWTVTGAGQRHPPTGMMRRMKRSNNGTVKAVSPRAALHTMPLAINCARVGPREVTLRSRTRAISPERGIGATLMGAGAEFCHRAQVTLLSRRQTVEAGAKEPGVEGGGYFARRALNIPGGNRRTLGNVPDVLAPLLQEVGIALRFGEDHPQGVRGDLGMLRPDRFGNRGYRRRRAERADLPELEQAFGVGLGLGHLSPQLRQSSAGQEDR